MGAPPWWWWPCGSILVEDGQLGSRNLDAGCRHYFLFLILTLLLLIQLLNSILGMRLPHLVLQLLTNGSIKKFWQRVTFATFTKLVAFSTPKTDLSFLCSLSHFRQNSVLEKTKKENLGFKQNADSFEWVQHSCYKYGLNWKFLDFDHYEVDWETYVINCVGED